MHKNSGKTVYLVHCVDTEGPLRETLSATFERVRETFGVNIPTSQRNLLRLQEGAIDLGDATSAVRKMVSPVLLAYNRNWEEVDEMLTNATSRDFRNRFLDSFGGGWIYSWFCVDHVGYRINPRRRDLGHHRVFDHYAALLGHEGNGRDTLFFHYHPMPYNGAAHSCATRYLNGNHLVEILARKVIDRGWFPTVFRPGFHTVRPDGHGFLEQWIPFDYGNQSTDEETDQPDLSGGRFGDWRRAPRGWGGYTPHHDDYQSVGNCRRRIFRCLNVGTRLRPLTDAHVDAAFAEAETSGSAVLAFTNHDFRDLRPDVEQVRAMLRRATERRPSVRFRYCGALDAARRQLGIRKASAPGLEVAFRRSPGERGSLVMSVESGKPLFGPQPFLAIADRRGGYRHDNFDFGERANCWSYTFDWQTIPADAVKTIGIAAPGSEGQVELYRYDMETGTPDRRFLHCDE